MKSLLYQFTLFYIIVINQIAKSNDVKISEAVRNSRLDNRVFNDQYFLKLVDAMCKIKCVQICAETYDCISFFYNIKQKKCRLHSTVFYNPDDGTPESDWTYYQIGERWCPVNDGFVLEQNSNMCIHVATQSFSDYNDARVYCEGKGGSLISLNTAAKLSQFTTIMNKIDSKYLVNNSPFPLNMFQAFIGLRKIGGTWTWDDGSVLGSETNWGIFQPLCASLSPCQCVTACKNGDWNWHWNDVNCDSNFAVVCEISK